MKADTQSARDASSAFGLYVFRPTQERVDAASLLAGLRADVDRGRRFDALVRAGEVESALADARSPSLRLAEALTDMLAREPLEEAHAPDVEPVVERLRAALDGTELVVSPPESFSYYGLHPLDFADAVVRGDEPNRPRAVIGVRSIGTTLSAVVTEALRARGARAERRTVRPTGEPYARRMELEDDVARWVRGQVANGAEVLVLDEGPGLSGSTLLAVVDALVAVGVDAEQVTVLCTREPDPDTLLAAEGARRWRSLRTRVVRASPRLPAGFVPLAAGEWRDRFRPKGAPRPASWLWLERAKGLSSDGRWLRKFEGLGRHGGEVRARAEALAEAGFGPPVRDVGEGRLEYQVLSPNVPPATGLEEATVDRLADYCAWRLERFAAGRAGADLDDMVRVNAERLLRIEPRSALAVVRPVVPDGRMMPSEWARGAGGALVKCDAVSHGDDQLFPGPTDVAWDLAGAIVEWRLSRGGIERLLARYRRRTADAPEERLPAWLLAYALFRLAWTELAAASSPGGAEHPALEREARSLRGWMRWAAAARLLPSEERVTRTDDAPSGALLAPGPWDTVRGWSRLR